MSVRCHLLILLSPVLSLCGATEYYVRPTESTNTSCPAQPCLTLSQYMNDSEHYFKSNTVFKFLPGLHHMDQPMIIGNVHNMSLENLYGSRNDQPLLVSRFSCESEAGHKCVPINYYHSEVCCAAVWLYDSYNMTIKGISVTTQAAGTSGIVIQHISNMHIQLVKASSSMACIPDGLLNLCVGILVSNSNVVEVHSSWTANYLYGFLVRNTNNVFITNITAMNNTDTGISFSVATNTTIINPKGMYNTYFGIYLFGTTNTTIINPKAMYNVIGIDLELTTNTAVINAFMVHNDDIGMRLLAGLNTTVRNPTVMFNGKEGIKMLEPHNVDIINASLMHNGYTAITMYKAINACIINTSVPLMQTTELSIIIGYILIMSSSPTSIYNSLFTSIGAAPNAASSIDPTSHPAVVVLYDSSLYVSGCNFTGNTISAIKAYTSNITAVGDITISNNEAVAGTAFMIVQNSMLRLTENSHVHFSNNHAINFGGIFYIAEYLNNFKNEQLMNIFRDKTNHPLFQSKCFLNVEGNRTQERLTFVNNSAGKGGDMLYGGQVALGVDGDWNCLESFSNISNISQNGLSLITSDPQRVCLCNDAGQPDCLTLLDPTPHPIYPGQSFNISAVIVGQQFGAVSGSVYAQFLQRSVALSSPQLDTWQSSQDVTQGKCNSLKFTIFSKNQESDAVLALTASNKKITQFLINATLTEDEEHLARYFYKTTVLDPMKYPNNPVYVNISVLSCPPGFMLTTEPPFRCDCNQLLQSLRGVSCHIQDQTIRRSGLVWVGTLKDNDETVTASEYCSYDYCNGGDSNVILSAADSQCNYNHSGTLCGGCQPGLSLALGNAQCLPCSNKYLALLIPFALAGPTVVFFIKLLDLTISQGTLNGLIFYANIVKANEFIFIPHGHTNPLTLFIAWLNLDLGVETCFFHGLTAYTKTWLQFVFPIYIWSIAGLIIILAKYSDQVAKVMGNNSVPVLATLFLLSYAKLFRTIITALSYTMLYSSQGHKAVWSADGNVDYLGSKHAPLFAVAVAALLFLWLPYTLLLFLGQWLHRCSYQLINQTLMNIKPFLDAHYGPLKGKHRYWFGTLLLVRAVILLMSAIISANQSATVNLCVSVSSTVLMLFEMIVYRNIIVAVYDVSFIMNLALLSVANMFTTMVRGDQMVTAYTLIGIAFFQFLGLVLFKVFSIFKRSDKVMACLYRSQPVEDDWELYEAAALHREIGSDTEEGGSEGSESVESFSTY